MKTMPAKQPSRHYEKYREWEWKRDNKEAGPYCLVKLLCDSCGYRWADNIRLTLPPCPECGETERIFEYETLLVG
jgi:rubrerythrin